ncbi:MAG: hypothetical protein AAFX94_01255 [Myxococcota bacterium]
MTRFATLALILVGCGGQDAALDFELVQDLNLNTTEQLTEWVDTIRLIVDSDDGLYTRAEAQDGDGFRIANVDSDPAYELVIDAPVPTSTLPRVRLERGGLPNGPLDIRLEGIGDSGTVLAAGGVSSVSFVDDTTSTLPVQFNLRSRYLPPRVLEAFPTNGEVTCRSGLALLLLSKSLDPSTVVEQENLIVERLDQAISLPLTMDVDGPVIRVAFGDFPEERAHYRIWLGGAVRDIDGMALDQDPRESGEQVFATEFFVEPSSACEDYPWRWCHEDAAALECPDFRSGRLRCDAGVCVPESCLESSCASGYVCDGENANCLIDCRSYGDFGGCSDGLACDEESGLCR